MHTRLLPALATLLLCRVALGQDQPAPPPPPATPTPAPVSSPDATPAPSASDETSAEASAGASAAPAASATGDSAAAIPEAEPVPASRALRGPLLLQVEGIDDAAAVEELRQALSAEFGCLVILRAEETRFAPQGRIVVARHAETSELAVTFVDAAEQSSTRVVQEPEDLSERARTVTLLAGTLARSPVEDVEVPPEEAAPEDAAPPAPPVQPAVASFFFPLATNYNVPDVHTHFAFSLLYGRIGSLDGLGVGTLQFARRGVQGAQIAFLGNAAGGKVAGLQAAFGVNSAGSVEGLQYAAVNHAAGEVNGAQLSFLNYAGGRVTGGQAAFTVNIARDVHGGQVAALNVAKHVRGVQVGIINVAERVDGVPIGLISVTKDGGVHPMAWFSSLTHLNAGLKFATDYTYTFMNASWDSELELFGPGFGLGGTVPVFLRNLYVDMDLSETYLLADSGPFDYGRSLTRLRATLRYQILPHLSVFAGGGYTGKVERRTLNDDSRGELYYESLGEFVAGIGL